MTRIKQIFTASALLVGGLGGQARAKLEIGLSPEQRTLSLGEPLVCTFSTANSGAEPVTLDLGLNREGAFRFIITAPDGTSRRVTSLPGGSVRLGNTTIEPGQAYNQTIRLSEWYDFRQVGSYTVEAALTTSPELRLDAFVVTILDRDPGRLKETCNRLLTTALGPSYQTAMEAALELRLISDPIAVPYLKGMLTGLPAVRAATIEGLERVGSVEAAEVLIRVRSGPDEEQRSRALLALKRMARTTRDDDVLKRLALAGITSK